MKANEVLEVLRISRITLKRLRDKGIIKAVRKPNGHYEYDEKSVYEYLLKSTGKQIERKTIIYARVSTRKQKKDLENRIELCKQFCISNGWKIHGIYKDVASALDFDNRKDFNQLIQEIMQYKVERVVISFRDRLTRTGFNFFENLFKTFGTQIVVINDYTNEKSDTEELMEEIFTLLHSFPMKFYSKRRTIKKCIENAIS